MSKIIIESNSAIVATKKTVPRFALWIWTFFWLLLTLYLAGPLVRAVPPEVDRHALDFRMRYNEAECVKSGRDPFLVWNGTLPRGRYVAWDFSRALDPENTNFIHAYPPWEYVWMMPLTFFSQDVAERIFMVLNRLGLLFLCVSAFMLGYQRMKGALWAGFAATASVLLVNNPMFSCLMCLNYGVVITVSVICAILCHRVGRDSLAGLFWAFAFIKPQIGFLFIVPLLIRGMWRTVLAAGGITVASTCVSAWLCSRSPIDMVLSIMTYSQGQFVGTGIIPAQLYIPLVAYCGDMVLMIGSAVIGFIACTWLCMVLRSCEDVWEWVLPSVFLSTVWTASRLHDQTIYAVMFLSLALSALGRRRPGLLLFDMVLVVLLVLRSVDETLPWPWPVNVFHFIAFVTLSLRAFRIRASEA